MSVHVFFNSQVTIRRLKTVSGSHRAYQATATVWGRFRGLGGEEAQALGLHPTRSFRLLVGADANIQRGDKVQLIETLQEGNQVRTRTRQFEVKEVELSKNWMVEYKSVLVEEVID